MNILEKTDCSCILNDDAEQWFDNLVATIRAHQIQIQVGLADNGLKEFYSAFINNNQDKLNELSRETSSRYLISKMLFTFIENLKKSKKFPIEIALQLSSNGINVWSVINDDDELTEKQLILSAAKTNADFYKLGLRIDTTILEKSDNFPIPNQFQKVIFTS